MVKYLIEAHHTYPGDNEFDVPYILELPKPMDHLTDHQQMLIAFAAMQNCTNWQLMHDFDEVANISFDNPELTEDGSYELQDNYATSFIQIGKISPASGDFIAELKQKISVKTVLLTEQHVDTLLCA